MARCRVATIPRLEHGEELATHLIQETSTSVRGVDQSRDGVTDGIARTVDRGADVSDDSSTVAGAGAEQSSRPQLHDQPVLVVEARIAVGVPVAATDARDERWHVGFAERADLHTVRLEVHVRRSPCKSAFIVSPTSMRVLRRFRDAAISRHAALRRAPIIRARRSGGTRPMRPLRTAVSITGTSVVSAISAPS